MIQRPVAIGLLVCEQVIIEEQTRNVTPVNCFTRKAVKGFPSVPFPFVVFAVLTDGMGEIPLDIVVRGLDDLEVFYRRSVSCQFANPLHEVRCVIRLRDCSFPVAGSYEISLLAERELIVQRKIRIFQKEKSE